MLQYPTHNQIMSSTYSFMSSPRYPQCPLSATGFLSREARVPSGVVSLKGKMKSIIYWKWAPVLLI
jgi:hypothetical protein